MGKLADYLVTDEHDVTFFIPEYSKFSSSRTNGTKLAKIIRMKDLTINFDDMMKGFDLFGPNTFSGRLGIEDMFVEICDSVLERRHELDSLKNYNFDLVLTNSVEYCGIGLAKYIGIKNQIMYFYILCHIDKKLGVTQPISYVPVVLDNKNSPKMNFLDRINNFYAYLQTVFALYRHEWKMTQLFKKHLGSNFPSISSLLSDTNLCFINGNEFLDAARPILHKTVYIGGLGLEDPKPLQEPYKSLMEKGQKGVIMLSLGTIAPTTFIKQSLKEEIFEAFSEFSDYHFIMKIDKNDEISRGLAAKFENIDVSDWLPQKDILAHTRLKLFIVHGGYNSLIESATRGVPVIVLPLFADQFRNAKNAEYRGFGYYLDKFSLGKESMKKALDTVLSNPSYKNSAIRLSHLIKDKPFTSEETFLRWTRFVAEHGILPELHVEALI
uniref:glucuronosyltransferase n=1 Tax=Acrobeloides nanus TaxID=290746 RepID=A0A914EFN7_9BILA